MNTQSDLVAPRARQHGLVVRALADEVLVYDRERNEAHALNTGAAAVWRLCDGGRTVADIAQSAGDFRP